MTDKRTATTPMDLHSALSTLLFAVNQALPRGCHVEARYSQSTYLSVVVECKARHKQLVIDRLHHGILWGPFNYRFSVSYSTNDPSDDQVVTGHLDLHNSTAPNGPIPFGNTPRNQDDRAREHAWGWH